MTEDVNNAFERDMPPVIAESRILAINAKYGFIDMEHFFVAMLTTECLAKSYLKDFEVEQHILWLQKLSPNTGKKTMKDSLPLTLYAERVIRQAAHIASLKEQSLVNSVHLLLAMLSYDNPVSELVKKKGLVFEDIAEAYFEEGLARATIELKLRAFKKPSRIKRFLRLGPSMETLSKDIYGHAHSLWTYQQYDDCITACQAGLELIPTFHELKTLLAYSFLKKRDHKNAGEYLRQLIELFPEKLGLQLSLAFCYDNSGDFQQSGEIFDKMMVLIPDDEGVFNNKGFSLYRQGKYAEAIPFFEQSIKINPLNAYPWDNLGFVKHKLGNTEEALVLIEKAMGLDKGNSYAYMYKGIIFMDQGNKALAMENFQLALKYGFTRTYGNEVLELMEKCK